MPGLFSLELSFEVVNILWFKSFTFNLSAIWGLEFTLEIQDSEFALSKIIWFFRVSAVSWIPAKRLILLLVPACH